MTLTKARGRGMSFQSFPVPWVPGFQTWYQIEQILSHLHITGFFSTSKQCSNNPVENTRLSAWTSTHLYLELEKDLQSTPTIIQLAFVRNLICLGVKKFRNLPFRTASTSSQKGSFASTWIEHDKINSIQNFDVLSEYPWFQQRFQEIGRQPQRNFFRFVWRGITQQNL